uniref:NADH-ubiquinone oxidoreductase chain 4 n=1 Tax=Timema californicum TaxID=61474 RepID=Q2Q1H4_TIMCA|nr:NADH dehydrogenase subunit 4 [Timema californicum]
MLKFILFILFLTPLSLMSNTWWLVQMMMLVITFMYFFCYVKWSIWCNLSYFMGCDIISYMLILLSFWVCLLMVMASQSVMKSNYNSKMFLMLIIILLLMLFCTFSCSNLLSFYLFFEISLIPTLLLILGWGYQPERLQASIYLLFYTLFASFPLLVSIMYLYFIKGSLSFIMFYDFNIVYFIFYLGMILAFLVKMPMFLVHLWLPSAHVEAPVSGSMILAGVLLKLGGYGLIRVFSLFISSGLTFNFIWISISLLGGFLVSLMCLRQVDLKSLIAYSSVAHMGIVLGGVMTLNYWGLLGSLILMLAHGLCSSGLFCLANIVYERSGSRSLMINKGLMNFMPSMVLWWFLLCSCNMSSPPSLNLLGEISLLNSLVSWSAFCMLMLMLISFFSAAYTLFLYSYSQHGSMYSGLLNCSMGYIREYHLLFLHWFPLNLMILNCDFVSMYI